MHMETELCLKLCIKMCTGYTTDVIWVNTKVYSATSEPTQTSRTHVSSFENSSALLKCIIATNSFMCVITIFKLYNMEENCLMVHFSDR